MVDTTVIIITNKSMDVKIWGQKYNGWEMKDKISKYCPTKYFVKKRKTLIYKGKLWETPSYVSDQS